MAAQGGSVRVGRRAHCRSVTQLFRENTRGQRTQRSSCSAATAPPPPPAAAAACCRRRCLRDPDPSRSTLRAPTCCCLAERPRGQGAGRAAGAPQGGCCPAPRLHVFELRLPWLLAMVVRRLERMPEWVGAAVCVLDRHPGFRRMKRPAASLHAFCCTCVGTRTPPTTCQSLQAAPRAQRSPAATRARQGRPPAPRRRPVRRYAARRGASKALGRPHAPPWAVGTADSRLLASALQVIWQVIMHGHCSFRAKTKTQNFCRNEYNVTGAPPPPPAAACRLQAVGLPAALPPMGSRACLLHVHGNVSEAGSRASNACSPAASCRPADASPPTR